jgi:hypothetical protein
LKKMTNNNWIYVRGLAYQLRNRMLILTKL